MSLVDSFLNRLVPHNCLGCTREGALLCPDCLGQLPPMPPRCYRCHRPSPGCLTCPECRAASPLHQVRIATVYTGPAKDLIWKLKSAGAKAAAKVMAARMAAVLSETSVPPGPATGPGRRRIIIVPVPTASTRARQRGYDQARLLARQLAKHTRQPYLACLARGGQAHQVGAGREQRLSQLEGAFRITTSRLVRDAHILLVDDVVTTGATLEAAAKILHQAGATRIDAVTFAQPLTKNYSRRIAIKS